MLTEFNHAANDSPRSGADKKITPLVLAAIVLVVLGAVVWLKAQA